MVGTGDGHGEQVPGTYVLGKVHIRGRHVTGLAVPAHDGHRVPLCPVLAVPPSPLEAALTTAHRRNAWGLRLDPGDLTWESETVPPGDSTG